MVMAPVCHEVVMGPGHVSSPGWRVTTAFECCKLPREWRKELKGMQVRPPVTTPWPGLATWPHPTTKERESKKYSPTI